MAPATKKTKRNDGGKASPSKHRDRDWGQYTHIPPSQGQLSKNGRQKGRNLITWNRPRMYEKLLLHIQYECARHRVDIPWDNIAHRFNPGSSGNAISQQLVRLRQTLVTEGHLVPPPLPKPGAPKQDPKVRGFARKFGDGSADVTTTEAVGWNEPFEDRRRNLPDAADYIDDEDDSMFATMTGDDTLDSNDFEDAEIELDTGDLVKKNKGKLPIKRHSSDDSDARSSSKQKKLKTVARALRAAVAKKGSYVEIDGQASEADDEGEYHDDDNAETTEATEEKKGGETSADESVVPSRTTTPVTEPASTTNLPDPFTTAPAASTQAILSHIPVIVTSASSSHRALRPSPAYSPLRVDHAGRVRATPSPIQSYPATLMVSPDGKAWTVPAFSLGGTTMHVTSTPMGPSAFATANSSPANFDFENATPRTAAAMRSHLNEWNAEEIPSVFTETNKFEEQLQQSVEKRKREA